MNCFHCGREIVFEDRVGFREECPQCDRPLHACLNCTFYDPAYNNQCRETQAERVVDKHRANFCEYFRPRAAGAAKPVSPAATGRAKLDALFKKKS
jgi:hypothetical protein